MSIKKDIESLIASEGKTVAIASNVTLSKWTRKPVRKGRSMQLVDVDIISVRISNVAGDHNGAGGTMRNIESRDYSGIIAEVESAIKETYAEAAERLASCIRNGYYL